MLATGTKARFITFISPSPMLLFWEVCAVVVQTEGVNRLRPRNIERLTHILSIVAAPYPAKTRPGSTCNRGDASHPEQVGLLSVGVAQDADRGDVDHDAVNVDDRAQPGGLGLGIGLLEFPGAGDLLGLGRRSPAPARSGGWIAHLPTSRGLVGRRYPSRCLAFLNLGKARRWRRSWRRGRPWTTDAGVVEDVARIAGLTRRR